MIVELLYSLKKSKVVLWKNGENIAYEALNGLSDVDKNCIKQFKTQLIELLEYNGIDSEKKAKEVAFYKSPESAHEKILSVMQQAIYLQSRLDVQKSTYTEPVFVLLKNVDQVLLNRAIITLLQRHPILRMSAISDDFKYKTLEINEFDIPTLDIAPADIVDLCKEKSKHEFDLNAGKLINIEVLHLKGTSNVVLNLTHHHILSDAHSIELMIEEIITFYSRDTEGEDSERRIEYTDFVLFQNYNLKTQDYEQAVEHLAGKLDNVELLQLNTATSGNFDHQAETFRVKIKASDYSKLLSISNKYQVGLYSVLLSGLYHVLSCFVGGKTNFPIAVNISNRTYDLNKVMGPCISTLPFMPKYDQSGSLLSNIKDVNNEVLYLHEHNCLNLNILAKSLRNRTSADLEELMRVMFTMYNKQSLRDVAHRNGSLLEYERLNQDEEIEKFGLSIDAIEQEDELHFNVSFAKNLYERSYVHSIMECLKAFLENINEAALFQPIGEVELLSEQQAKTIMYAMHNEKSEYLLNSSIHKLFELQAEKTPNNIALVYGDTRMTYKELNERTNQLAWYLKTSYSICLETLVPLYLDRSEHMLIAILAVLKTGAAYVPIDINYPKERIQFILQDIKADFILTNEVYKDKLSKVLGNVEPIELDSDIMRKRLACQHYKNLSVKVAANNLAYVIYTSGTTGLPKGVLVEHGGVINLKYDLTYKYNLQEGEVILQLANYVFDASVEQIVISLLNGHTLLLVKTNLWLDKHEFYYYLNKNSVTHFEATPTLLEQYDYSKITTLRRIVSGGEYFSKECHSRIKECNVKCIINTYGPTETTIDAAVNIINDDNICIGKPITNTQCYVLSQNLKLLPVGAIGELFIGGKGLTRGYLNRADLTAEKFVANPFSNGSRLYKTGDLVRMTPEFNLEYVGRNDFQVKIRGYRIELKEIEATLLQYPGINQAKVIAKSRSNSTEKYLVGYYVSSIKLDETDILHLLQTKLPEYMVPSVLVYLETMPTTVNGKLDIKALPEPTHSNLDKYIAPRDMLETKICSLWSQVLGIPEDIISIDADFFKLGGSSILAIKFIDLLNNSLDVKNNIRVKDLYINSTIAKLSKYLQGSRVRQELVRFEEEVNLDDTIRPISNAKFCYEAHNNHVVLLTGATGFIGAHLVKELSDTVSVDKIFCLVMAETKESAELKLHNALQQYRLTYVKDKVHVVVGTLSKRHFGLKLDEYNSLANEVGIVIHAATYMNHLVTYEAAKQVNVHGTEEILRFACTMRQKIVNHVSSVNVFSSNKSFNNVPDEDSNIVDMDHYYSEGYSTSKWVSEGLCNLARARGINCNIFRLSLILPSTTLRVYPKQQWFGRFIKACLNFGIFPSQLHDFKIQVACVDEVSKAIVYAAIDPDNVNKNFHLFSNKTLSFANIFARMKALYNCKDVDMSEWINKYESAKLAANSPVISFIEEVATLNDYSSISQIVLSEKTMQHLKNYNFSFAAQNDEYIDALINGASLTEF